MNYDSLLVKGFFIIRDLYYLSPSQLKLIEPYFPLDTSKTSVIEELIKIIKKNR